MENLDFNNMKYIEKLSFEEKFKLDNWGYVCFCPEINEYMLVVIVPYVAYYERYYWISKEDFLLAKSDLTEFRNKYKDVFSSLMESPKGITFMGAQALRDYDGIPNFQNYIKTGIKGIGNPFYHFFYKDKVLYAHIIMNGSHYAVIPRRMIKNEQGEYFCSLENEKNVKTFYGNVNGEETPLFIGIEVNSFKNDQYVD